MSSGAAREVVDASMSIEAWAALAEDETGEFVDGVVVEEEMAGFAHEVAVTFLIALLRTWGISRGALVGGSAGKFAVSGTRGRMPDVTVFLAGAPRPPRWGVIRVPPSIAVEVVSTTPRDARRDRIEKLTEYAAFGVRWYWLVDPAARTFEILELGEGGRYVHVVAVTAGHVDQVPGCEQLEIDVDALWAEIDALPDESAAGQERIVACLGWGAASLRNPKRDAWLGWGFETARRPGSAVHDEILFDEATHAFRRRTNMAGGTEGGMTSGAPLVVRVAFKPLATLMKPLHSVDIETKAEAKGAIERSDVCAVPAAAVIAEAVVAFVVADAFLEKFGGDSVEETRRNHEAYLKALSIR